MKVLQRLTRVALLALASCTARSEPAAPPSATVLRTIAGAWGDGRHDETAALQRWIGAARAHDVLTLPPGRYRVTRALRIEIDALTLEGPGAVLVMDPPAGGPMPGAVLVHRGDLRAPSIVKDVVVRRLRVDVLGGADGSSSFGAIQLNACVGCLVEDVRVDYVGAQPGPKNLDGIVTSQGSSGVIRRVVVRGIPKVAIYAAAGTHDLRIEQCVASHGKGFFGAVGISLNGALRTEVQDCEVDHNQGAGVLIAVNGDTQRTAARSIRLERLHVHHNGGDGVLVASSFPESRPSDVALIDVISHANLRGIDVQAGTGVRILRAVVHDNVAEGILIDSVAAPFIPLELRATEVTVLDATVFDNGRGDADVGGIVLRAAHDVLIKGGRIYRSDAKSRQRYGVLIVDPMTPNGALDCSGIMLDDIDAATGHVSAVAYGE